MADDPIKIVPFTLNGKDVDIRKSVPLDIGDLKALKKAGCDLIKLGDKLELEHLAALALHICHKANPEVTEADVDTLPLPWLQRIAKAAGQANEADLPF